MLVCLLSISCQYTFTTYSLAGGDNLLRHITLKLSHYLTHVPRDYRDLLAVLRSGAWCDNSAGGARWWWWCSCGVSSACCARLWPRDRVSRRHVATLADSAGRGAAADTARWQRTRDTGGGRVLKLNCTTGVWSDAGQTVTSNKLLSAWLLVLVLAWLAVYTHNNQLFVCVIQGTTLTAVYETDFELWM